MCNVKVNLLRWLISHDVVTMTDYMDRIDIKVYNVTLISIANLMLQLIYGMVSFRVNYFIYIYFRE